MLRVATWNIHRGIGSDGREDLGRTVDVLRELSPDIIALQEVGYHSRSRTDVARTLAEALDARLVPGITLTDVRGDYGNALLTTLPVERVQRLPIGVAGREPRGVIEARLRARGVSLRVLATHLGLKHAERRRQLARVTSRLAQQSAAVELLLGDFNEWLPYGRGLRRMARLFGAGFAAPATFPARAPVLALDRIWARPAGIVQNIRVHRSPLARVASDHLPLIAELDIGGVEGGVKEGKARVEGEGVAGNEDAPPRS